MEEWKDIIGYEGLYQISNMGRVKSLKRLAQTKDGRIIPVTEKILKPRIQRHGYYAVALYKEYKVKYISIHRLVAIHFVDNPNNENEVNHEDGNKQNNIFSNLTWMSHSGNVLHSVHVLGNKPVMFGEKHHKAKLKDEDVLFIRQCGLKTTEICEMFGLSKATVKRIRNRKI